MKTMSLIVSEFEVSDQLRRLSKSSRKRSGIVIGMLVEVFGAKTPISRLEPYHLDTTLAKARDAKCGESTINAYKTDLRRFCAFLKSRRYVSENPALELKNVHTSTPAYKRKPISNDSAGAVIKIANATHPRDGMTALILLTTGMRASEVVGLLWNDLNITAGVAKAYRPKIRDWHEAVITDELAENLIRWRNYCEKRHGSLDGEWYVVPALAHRGERPGYLYMNPDWPMVPTRPQNDVGGRVKRWLAESGETDLRGRAAHTLRRTAGNLLLDLPDMEVRDVQTFFGHKSLADTELYLDLDQAKKKLSQKMRTPYRVGSPSFG